MKTHKSMRMLCASIGAGAVLAASQAGATEMVYYPINPTFGGSPLNGSVLMNRAQAQNKHKDPESEAARMFDEQTPLEQFNEMMERSVLNRLASLATQRFTGENGNLQPGTVETDNFTIDIVDLGGGSLRVTTTDRLLGTSTSFEVGQ